MSHRFFPRAVQRPAGWSARTLVRFAFRNGFEVIAEALHVTGQPAVHAATAAAWNC
ncbi:MAG: hypothetical protein JO046_01705 [Solirubrobacterales bacterium]|nr:hypothetical protein [Solirubrobacterales bacterium]